ncbi:MAG: hypothetical protein M1831_004846 [Alyxoria varia]|nr:MAG: hypothetical protein M1831_004846 [Alyxoria varia]
MAPSKKRQTLSNWKQSSTLSESSHIDPGTEIDEGQDQESEDLQADAEPSANPDPEEGQQSGSTPSVKHDEVEKPEQDQDIRPPHPFPFEVIPDNDKITKMVNLDGKIGRGIHEWLKRYHLFIVYLPSAIDLLLLRI